MGYYIEPTEEESRDADLVGELSTHINGLKEQGKWDQDAYFELWDKYGGVLLPKGRQIVLYYVPFEWRANYSKRRQAKAGK